jgi:hypothetical protein
MQLRVRGVLSRVGLEFITAGTDVCEARHLWVTRNESAGWLLLVSNPWDAGRGGVGRRRPLY